MTLKDFLTSIESPNDYLKEGYSEDQIRALTNSQDNESAKTLQMLFCYAISRNYPNPHLLAMQEKMRKENYPESVIMELSVKLMQEDYPDPRNVHDAFSDAFGATDMLRDAGKGKYSALNLETLYDMQDA